MTSSKCFDDLPNEILLKIFSYLNFEDLAFSIQDVSLRWRLLSQDELLWRDVVFCPDKDLTEEQIINKIKKMPALKSFCSAQNTSPFVLQYLCKWCKKITSIDLDLHQCMEPALFESILNAFPNIETLKLPLPTGSVMEEMKSVKLMAQCKTLETLTLKWNRGNIFTIADFVITELVHGCPALKHLDCGNFEIVDERFFDFLEMKKDQLLSLVCTIEVTKKFSEKLSKCSKLQSLNIINLDATMCYGDIEPLTKLKTLQRFELNFSSDCIMDELPLFFLSGSFSKIVHLNLSNSYHMNDEIVHSICKNCPLLKYFAISGSQSLQDEGLKFIGYCKHLEHLDVSMSMALSDGSMEYVGDGCSNLKHLIISGCYKMTDNVIQHIVKCKQLKVLKFNYNDLTGSSFHLINSHLHSLVEFHIENCKHLNGGFIQELHKNMPHLKIVIARRYKPQLNYEESAIILNSI